MSANSDSNLKLPMLFYAFSIIITFINISDISIVYAVLVKCRRIQEKTVSSTPHLEKAFSRRNKDSRVSKLSECCLGDDARAFGGHEGGRSNRLGEVSRFPKSDPKV